MWGGKPRSHRSEKSCSPRLGISIAQVILRFTSVNVSIALRILMFIGGNSRSDGSDLFMFPTPWCQYCQCNTEVHKRRCQYYLANTDVHTGTGKPRSLRSEKLCFSRLGARSGFVPV